MLMRGRSAWAVWAGGAKLNYLSASLGGSSEGRSVGIGLGRRAGSAGRMLKMLLRTTITPRTTADPDTKYTCGRGQCGLPRAPATRSR
eukprot:5284153-Prymnesium_polylepis.1